MVQGSSPTLSGTTKQQVQNLDQSWSQVVSNEEVLEKSLQTIQASRAKFMAPSGYGIYKTTDVDRQSLKMQKQEDIQSQIDYDNNLLILTGAALALCVLLSFQLYLD